MGIASIASTSHPTFASTDQRQIPFKKHSRTIKTAPFGGDVSSAISYYSRVSPYISNAGLLHGGGLEESKSLGFKLVIDLRKPSEKGVAAEQKLAADIGLDYMNIPVANKVPNWDQVDELASVISLSENYPILIHCVTANRAGAIWSLYRARMGVPPEIAVEEGRAAGLANREDAVRKQLGI